MKKIIAIILSLSFPLLIFAQNISRKDSIEQESAEEVIKSLSVPSIPALDFISSQPNDISRPSTAKEFAASLYNGIDESGNVKQGLAVETKLSNVFDIGVTSKEYEKDSPEGKYGKYLLYNTQLSLGTVATSGDSTSTDLGWGIRLTLFDNSDPMRYATFKSELGSALIDCIPSGDPDDLNETEEMACLANKVKTHSESFRDSTWNRSWLTVAYAGGTRLKGSQFTEGEIVGHQLWIAGGLRLGKWGQLGYLTKLSTRLHEGVQRKMQELSIGSNLVFGQPTYNLFAEAAYNPLLNKNDFDQGAIVDTEKVLSWSAGVEFLVAKRVWAVAGLGQKADRIVGNNGIQLLSGLRMGISDKSRIGGD